MVVGIVDLDESLSDFGLLWSNFVLQTLLPFLSEKKVGKVPRKIHKAAREKLKRASMNELFLDLGKTLSMYLVSEFL